MAYLILFSLLLVSSCKEFYDDDFKADQAKTKTERSTGSQQGTLTSKDITYSAELKPTDPKVKDLTGNVQIDVRNNEVSVDLVIKGIPQNIIHLYYSYITADCSNIVYSIPNNSSTTRNYKLSEDLSLDALAEDLRSSGAASRQGDVNLTGKTFIVKAVTNFGGTPSENGTGQFVILCGKIKE